MKGVESPPLLATLLGLFPLDGLRPADIELVDRASVPEPYRKLLVHRAHMTVTLEEHHGSKLELVVLDRRRDGDDYARKLLLRAGPAGKVVLVGVMRLQLDICDERVREKVVSESLPLGRILIEHEVLRWIEPQAYFRIRLGDGLARLFEAPAGATFTYGRIAGIVCSSRGRPGPSGALRGELRTGPYPERAARPAVELLEIVSPENS